MFPYHLIERGSKIVLYGAGEVMRCYVRQLQTVPYCEIICAVDRNHNAIETFRQVEVLSPDEIVNLQYDAVVIATSPKLHKGIRENLAASGVPIENIVNASYHSIGSSFSPEALIIKNIFDSVGLMSPSYLDIGAYHPDWSSNTSLFYEKGCRGINIEADISLIDAFAVHRSEDINVNVGVAPERGIGTFHVFEGRTLSTFDPETAKRYSGYGLSCEENIHVELWTINDIVDKYNGGLFPDFLDMDIEGLDYEVLKGADFTKSSPKIICVEIYGENSLLLSKVLSEKQCEGGGYTLYCRIEPNSIYVRNDLRSHLTGLHGNVKVDQ